MIRDHPERGEVQEDLLGDSDGSPPTARQDSPHDDGEARNGFWSIARNDIYRHHVEPRVKLNVPKEETFPIPLTYIDVTRSTNTTLDVLLERRIDDYLNVDGDRELSDAWTGFTRFTILNERSPEGYTWYGGRLTKKQATSRPDHLWPEIWKNMSDAAQRREKQKWVIEKPRLDSARRLRKIYFIDPKDEEFKETLKNARRKLEMPMEAAMPCKVIRSQHAETRSYADKFRTKFACIVEADESTRRRLEGALPQNHEDHIAGRGINSLNH